uniref:CDC42 effector protein (Rho GTPase binding) 1a n=1 Tax=Sinocyclocheilus grahami TaxID=75366 RepID=A0A672JVZ6_SINGR
MNLGKLAGLKGLVSHSSGKRRFKGDLTPDMISPPLSDFRHTMHVGRGGDVFGDTSFLSNHGGGSSPSACPLEIHRGSLTDTGIPSFPCSDSISPSDSMNSFTLDLGPSLMSEVFAMIDSPVCEKADPISEKTQSTDDNSESHDVPNLILSLAI